MSINSCSINEYTINTLCGRRRAIIIDSLLPHNKGSQQHVSAETRVPLNIFRRDSQHEHEITFDPTKLEQPFIQVTVEMMGETFSQTLPRQTDGPLITVFALSVQEIDSIQVNISDIKLKVL